MSDTFIFVGLTIPVTALRKRPYVQRCVRDGILAPTQQQRLNYRQFLPVYARNDAWMSARMAELVDIYKVRSLLAYTISILYNLVEQIHD